MKNDENKYFFEMLGSFRGYLRSLNKLEVVIPYTSLDVNKAVTWIDKQ